MLVSNGTLRVEQYLLPPAVYFDHWAMMHVSNDLALRSRFKKTLKARGGTLMLSWLNLAEFAKVIDRSQAEAAEALIEDVLPNIFFLEMNPFDVIKREDQLLAGGPLVAPHADTEFLKAFTYMRSQSMHPFTARNLFTAAQNIGDESGYDALAKTVVESVEALREKMGNDKSFDALVRRLPNGPEIQRGTRYILRELAGTLLMDRSVKMNQNHGIDLVHSVVPAAYGDLVLLDGHWEAQIEKIRGRFSKAKLTVPLARVFSGRRNGIEKFLQELESSSGS